MVALRSGDPARARRAFEQARQGRAARAFARAGRRGGSPTARGRAAIARPRRSAYAKLDRRRRTPTRPATSAPRCSGSPRSTAAPRAAYRALIVAHPAHPLARRAPRRSLLELGARAADRRRAHRAREAPHRRAPVGRGDRRALAGRRRDRPPSVAHQRDYWLGTTLFKMRRRYGDAGKLLLGVYPKLGDSRGRGDVPRRARAVARRSRRRRDRLVPQGRRDVSAARRTRRRRSS